MKQIDDLNYENQSPYLSKLKAMEALEERDQLSLMFKRQEESCKLETDLEIPSTVKNQQDDEKEVKLSNKDMASNITELQGEQNEYKNNVLSPFIERDNNRTMSRVSIMNNKNLNNSSFISRNLIYDYKKVDSINQDGDYKTPEDGDITQMLESQNLYQGRKAKQSRLVQQNSIQLINSQQVIKNQAGNTGNAQKELMNRFLMMYAKQKNQITTLDVIVKLKIKLQGFFEKYTYSGRVRQIKKNPKICEAINDKSDGQILLKKLGIFGKIELLSRQITKCIFKYSGKFKILSKILSFFLNMLKKFIRFSQGKISSVEFFKPHHTPLLIFNLSCIVLNCIFLYFLSVYVVYQNIMDIPKSITYHYFILMLVLWIIEFFVRINTAEIFRTNYVQNRMQTFRKYIKEGFISDFMPMIGLLVSITNEKALFFVFLKYLGLRKDIENAEKKLLMRLNRHYYIQMINLAANIFLIGHVIGIMYYLTARIELDFFDETYSWLDTRIAVEGDWYKIYLQSLYWAFTLLTTGSNEVETGLEMFFTTFIMMFTGAIFAYIFNTIANIIEEMNLVEQEKKKDINLINNYMRRRKISSEVQHKANEDLEFFYQTSYKKKSEEEKQVLSKISLELTNKMQLEYNRVIINKIKVLTDNFSPTTIDSICFKVDEQFYSPNQIIIEQDSQFYQSPSLIFIVNGSVEIFEKLNNQNEAATTQLISGTQENNSISVVKEYKKGDIIGEVNFFNGQSMNIFMRSQDFTTILKIDRDIFLDVLKNNQRDFQKFCEIKDKILLYSEFKSLNLKCSICRSSQHLLQNCPLSHFRSDNPFLFAKYNKSVDQQRDKEYERKIPQQFNAYTDMFIICSSVNKILDQIQIDSQLDQIYSSLTNMTEEEIQEEEDQDLEDDQITQTLTKTKDNSVALPNNNQNNQSQLSVIPPIEQSALMPQQSVQLYGHRSRRQSREHSFLPSVEKNYLTNQLSIHNPSSSYQQFESYQILANSDQQNNFNGNHSPIEKQLSQGQQIQVRFEENYNREPSSTSLKENNQTQPIFLRRRHEQTIITQIKNFLKDPNYFNVREESIRTQSQSKNNSKQIQKQQQAVNHITDTQYGLNMEKIKQQNFYWYFDHQKDFLHYFPEGNMFLQIQKYNNKKKKIKDRNQPLTSRKDSFSPVKKAKKSMKRIY
ncbi:cyclic nucleotide-binding domain protein (macronuclear) [Tetrahymena thermophila SB210]|uniref:Cyclic nucleotide-binding domain protein n=1 Tax=Tetrahymena thermophila (strain SB210) TaxID=312017 RepID=I7M2L7_TETTS|nr:cyclic nucleotide-binding domain protein [Tetrahymena thermophila SB210]EAS00775.2 cyclic nucleotide-binding domain protein [Tetrahymena thermophila SB210]|eukprot:XP_001021020.2 cyclic nucleotide-binding domain protein [Tetrahymena thermophila SB210]